MILRARCRIVQAKYWVVQTQFDVEPAHEWVGEYVLFNLMRERGDLIDGARYQIEIKPLLPRLVKG